MRSHVLLTILFCSLLSFSHTSQAEEFLGVVSEDEINEPASDKIDNSIPTESNSKKWRHTIGLGGSLNSFQGQLISSYQYNKYIRPEIRLNYSTTTNNEIHYNNYSAEFPVLFYLANPTILWPYFSLGLEYKH